jgi:hypothetical protein
LIIDGSRHGCNGQRTSYEIIPFLGLHIKFSDDFMTVRGYDKSMEKRQRYLSYLLRLWQTSDGGRLVWRALLETPGTGERRGFASLEELFEFLDAQTGQDMAKGETRPRP